MKNLAKFLIYLWGTLFYHNRKSKVLYYHDVSKSYTDMGTPLSLLRSHLEVIKANGFSIVERIMEPNNQVMIAFDDGWKGLYDNRDFFIAENINPTIFIAVDLIGKDGYMTKEQIIELSGIGFHFQAHAWTHTGLPDHHGEDLIHEVSDSKVKLESMFSHSFDQICFPQGRFSDEVIEACLSSGYQLMYTSLPGSYYDFEDKKLICRNLVQNTPSNHIQLILTGDVPYLRKRYIKQHYSN